MEKEISLKVNFQILIRVCAEAHRGYKTEKYHI